MSFLEEFQSDLMNGRIFLNISSDNFNERMNAAEYLLRNADSLTASEEDVTIYLKQAVSIFPIPSICEAYADYLDLKGDFETAITYRNMAIESQHPENQENCVRLLSSVLEQKVKQDKNDKLLCHFNSQPISNTPAIDWSDEMIEIEYLLLESETKGPYVNYDYSQNMLD